MTSLFQWDYCVYSSDIVETFKMEHDFEGFSQIHCICGTFKLQKYDIFHRGHLYSNSESSESLIVLKLTKFTPMKDDRLLLFRTWLLQDLVYPLIKHPYGHLHIWFQRFSSQDATRVRSTAYSPRSYPSSISILELHRKRCSTVLALRQILVELTSSDL